LDSIAKRIGVDVTGARFNSIIAIEGVRATVGSGAPEMNPLVNPGAISATSMVRGANADEVWKKIIGFHNDAAGRQLSVMQDVYKSESDTNQRNQAIGALMFAYGYIKDNWQQAVDLYTRQCSIGVNARDLATMAATLAAGGRNPVTGKQVKVSARSGALPRRGRERCGGGRSSGTHPVRCRPDHAGGALADQAQLVETRTLLARVRGQLLANRVDLHLALGDSF
jgi:glutaminase